MNMMERHEEMGIKPYTAHTGDQVPELHVSEFVFTSDNHNNNEPLLWNLAANFLLGSICVPVSFI